MPYTYQPSGANYCFYHEDGYPVCVGDGSKPSQKNNRYQKPHGVPILTKIKDKPNPVEEAQKKKVIKIRKKEYDRLYAHANRKYKKEESKGALTRSKEYKQELKDDAKKKLKELKASNDKLVKVREKKDDKEKELAITKFKSQWKNTDRGKSFKKRMDGIKEQKDGTAKKKALEKVKKQEKEAREKHMEIKSNSIKVLEADIDKLEREEKKAYGLDIIKKQNEKQRNEAASLIQKLERRRQAVVDKKNKAKEKDNEKEKEKLEKEQKELEAKIAEEEKRRKEAILAIKPLSELKFNFLSDEDTDDDDDDFEYVPGKQLKEEEEKKEREENKKEKKRLMGQIGIANAEMRRLNKKIKKHKDNKKKKDRYENELEGQTEKRDALIKKHKDLK